MRKKVLLSGSLVLLLIVILAIFWQQENMYIAPTPVPDKYQSVAIAQKVILSNFGIEHSGRPALLHFFNPDSPCSRFNKEHIISLAKEYADRVDFPVVLQQSIDTLAVREMHLSHGITLSVLADANEALAKAVAFTQHHKLYY